MKGEDGNKPSTSRVSLGRGGSVNIYHYYRNAKSGTRRRGVLFLETWCWLWSGLHSRGSGMLRRVMETFSDKRGLVCVVCLKTKTKSSYLMKLKMNWFVAIKWASFLFFLSMAPLNYVELLWQTQLGECRSHIHVFSCIHVFVLNTMRGLYWVWLRLHVVSPSRLFNPRKQRSKGC